MTLAFSVLAPYQVSLPPPPQCQARNQTRIRSDIQTVSPRNLITTRRSLLHHSATILLYFFTGGDASAASAVKFFEIAGSGGVKALELRAGSGGTPRDGDEVIRTHSIFLCLCFDSIFALVLSWTERFMIRNLVTLLLIIGLERKLMKKKNGKKW